VEFELEGVNGNILALPREHAGAFKNKIVPN
jgi:hypothetical protein